MNKPEKSNYGFYPLFYFLKNRKSYFKERKKWLEINKN